MGANFTRGPESGGWEALETHRKVWEQQASREDQKVVGGKRQKPIGKCGSIKLHERTSGGWENLEANRNVSEPASREDQKVGISRGQNRKKHLSWLESVTYEAEHFCFHATISDISVFMPNAVGKEKT